MGRQLKKKDKNKKKKQAEDSQKKAEEKENSVGIGTRTSSGVGSTGVIGSIAQKVSPQKKTVPGSKAPTARQDRNFIERSLQFLREVKVELKKVTWPSRKQTIGSTIVVIVVVMIISFLLGAMDIGLSSIVKFLLQ